MVYSHARGRFCDDEDEVLRRSYVRSYDHTTMIHPIYVHSYSQVQTDMQRLFGSQELVYKPVVYSIDKGLHTWPKRTAVSCY